MEFMFFEVYIVYGQTEFPFRKPFETEFTIFPNGKGTFLKRKIITPTPVDFFRCASRPIRISRLTLKRLSYFDA